MKLRIATLLCALVLGGCASELHTSSSLDVAETKTEDAHAEEHAQAQDHVEDHSAERTAENVVTTTTGGAVELDEVRTLPNGTKVERHFRRAAVETKVDAHKHENVQKAISADASSLLDGSTDTTAKTVAKVKAKDELGKKSKPSLGFLAALTPWFIGICAVIALVAFAWLTHGNPFVIARKVLGWVVSKVRGQPTAG